jgi:tetratricopeptide (TPR) repeat protein
MSVLGRDFNRFVRTEERGPVGNRLDAAFQAEGTFLKGYEAQLRGLPTDEVIHYYDEAIRIAPLNWNLRNEVCSYLVSKFRLHYFRGEYAEATSFIRRAVETYPDDAAAHASYAVMLWKMNQADLAVDEFQRALVLNPRLVSVRRNLASIFASSGQGGKAVEQWRQALAIDPNDLPTLVEYGIFLIQEGSNTEALQYLRRAYQVDSEYPQVIDGYARVLYLTGDISQARSIVLKGGKYYKGNPLLEKHRAAILGEK